MPTFNEQLPEWNEEGVEPLQSKKNSGWAVEEKPPAGWFNWLHHRTFKCLEEIRDALALIAVTGNYTDLSGIPSTFAPTEHDDTAHSIDYATDPHNNDAHSVNYAAITHDNDAHDPEFATKAEVEALDLTQIQEHDNTYHGPDFITMDDLGGLEFMQEHGNEYHDPNFITQTDLETHLAGEEFMQEHGNEWHSGVGFVSKSGDTLLGALVAHSGTDYTTLRVRNIYLSTEDPNPNVGANGDIWLKYQV